MLELTDHGSVREIRLAHPPANALGPALLGALEQALMDAVRAGVRGLVLSGAEGRFSGGMDVPALLAMDSAGVRATWAAFLGVLRALARSPIPITAALTGHSPAGGTVMALFADYRVLAEGPYLVGMNEVQVGLAVPACLFDVLAHAVGARQAARLATSGLLVQPAEARAIGLVDEVVPLAEVVPRALAWVTELLQRPPLAMAATRALARTPLNNAADQMTDALLDDVVRQWFGAECQKTMTALVERMRARTDRPAKS